MNTSRHIQFIPSYIETLATLLVFGITLPSLLISVPSRIRAVRDRHARKLRFFQWEISSREVLRPEHLVVVVVIFGVLSTIVLLSYMFLPEMVICMGEADSLWCRTLQLMNTKQAFIIHGTLFANIATAAFFIWVLVSYTPNRVLSRLISICRYQSRKNNGKIDRQVLESIGEIGEFSKGGSDKEAVLHTLEELTELDLDLDSLAGIARTIQETVVDGNEHNYIYAIDILQDMARQIHPLPNYSELNKGLCLAAILKELENIIVRGFHLNKPSITAAIMSSFDELSHQAPNDYARAFLEISKTALGIEEIRHAGHALDKLHTRISECIHYSQDCLIETPEALHTYFGLLAHFWNHNNTARKHALKYLNELGSEEGWSQQLISEQIYEAEQTFQTIDIETADYLDTMLHQLEQRRIANRVLREIKPLSPEQRMRILTHYPSIKKLKKVGTTEIMACGVDEEVAHQVVRECRAR